LCIGHDEKLLEEKSIQSSEIDRVKNQVAQRLGQPRRRKTTYFLGKTG
jgi:hypothetical protein